MHAKVDIKDLWLQSELNCSFANVELSDRHESHKQKTRACLIIAV